MPLFCPFPFHEETWFLALKLQVNLLCFAERGFEALLLAWLGYGLRQGDTNFGCSRHICLVPAAMSPASQASAVLKAALLPTDLEGIAIASLFSSDFHAREQLADLILSIDTSPVLHPTVEEFLQQNAAGDRLSLLHQHHMNGT